MMTAVCIADYIIVICRHCAASNYPFATTQRPVVTQMPSAFVAFCVNFCSHMRSELLGAPTGCFRLGAPADRTLS